MTLIAKTLIWALNGGAGISLIVMIIGYKNDEARTFHFGFYVGLILGILALICNIINYFI